jgi:hypothetical protein
MSGYIDGNFSTPFLTKNTVSYPLSDKPNNANVAQFDLTYVVWANSFSAANVGTTNPDAPNAYLFQHGSVENLGANVLQYTRSYIQQPFTWYDCEQLQYSYPGLDSGVGTSNWIPYGARNAMVIQKLATVKHDYVINANIPSGNVTNVTIITLNGQPINRIGQWYYGSNVLTVPNTDPVTYVVSSDPTRYKGNLWEIVTKTVGAPNVFFP